MKPFDQPIGTRMVGGGPGTGDAEECHQVFPQMGLELTHSVRSEGGWDAKSCDPTEQECLGHRFCAGVSEWDDFRPTGEAIHTGEKVGETVHRGQRADQIYVDMVEPGIWGLELANGGPGVHLNFGTLTCQACAGPVSDILVHAGPDVLRGN